MANTGRWSEASGSGTTELFFEYTVMPGDVSYDLEYVDSHALEFGYDEAGEIGLVLEVAADVPGFGDRVSDSGVERTACS